MNDMWSRIKRVNDWHAKAIVTGDFSDAPLADIACVSNFARERLRDIEDMSDQRHTDRRLPFNHVTRGNNHEDIYHRNQ